MSVSIEKTCEYQTYIDVDGSSKFRPDMRCGNKSNHHQWSTSVHPLSSRLEKVSKLQTNNIHFGFEIYIFVCAMSCSFSYLFSARTHTPTHTHTHPHTHTNTYTHTPTQNIHAHTRTYTHKQPYTH